MLGLKDARQVKAYLGLVGYYRKFCPNFAQLSAPLRKLTQKDAPSCGQKRQKIHLPSSRTSWLNSITLKFPDFNKEMWVANRLFCRWSGLHYSPKRRGGNLRPLLFGGRALGKHEKSYPITHLEGLAVIVCLKDNAVYFGGNKPIHIFTDHSALQFLKNSPN